MSPSRRFSFLPVLALGAVAAPSMISPLQSGDNTDDVLKTYAISAKVVSKFKSPANPEGNPNPNGAEILTAGLEQVKQEYLNDPKGGKPKPGEITELPVDLDGTIQAKEGPRSDGDIIWIGSRNGKKVGIYFAKNIDFNTGSPSKNDVESQRDGTPRYRLYYQLETGDTQKIRQFCAEFYPENFKANFNALVNCYQTGDLKQVVPIMKKMTAFCHQFTWDEPARQRDLQGQQTFKNSPAGEGSGRKEKPSWLEQAINIGIHGRDRYWDFKNKQSAPPPLTMAHGLSGGPK